MSAAARYTDKRLDDPFVAHVFLTEPLTFRPSEILAAVRNDYPGLAWTDRLQLDLPITTGQVGLGALLPEGDATAEPNVVLFTSRPGRFDGDLSGVIAASRNTFPAAAEAIARHQTWLTISLRSRDRSLAARYDAARRVTCLAAVFARLPICLAGSFPSSDQIVAPADWVRTAAIAMRAGTPIPVWIAPYANPVISEGQRLWTVGTIGLAALLGREVVMPNVTITPNEAGMYVASAACLLLERGHTFRDGDTLGLDSGGPVIRVRHAAEGFAGFQTDHWVLIHPDSHIDEMAQFGPRPRQPAPPGVDNTNRGDPDSLRKKLYAFVTGARRGPENRPSA